MPSCKCVVFIGVLYLINAHCAPLATDLKAITATTGSPSPLETRPKPTASNIPTGDQAPLIHSTLAAVQDPQKRGQDLAGAALKSSQNNLRTEGKTLVKDALISEEAPKEQPQITVHNAETHTQPSSMDKAPSWGSHTSLSVNQKIIPAAATIKNANHPATVDNEHPINVASGVKSTVSSTTTAPMRLVNENGKKTRVEGNSAHSQFGSLSESKVEPSKLQPSNIIGKVGANKEPAEVDAPAVKAKLPKPHANSIQLEQGPPKQQQEPPKQQQGPPEKQQGPPEKQQGPPEKQQRPPEKQQRPPEKQQGPPEKQQGPPEKQQGPPEKQQGPSEKQQGPSEKQQGPREQQQEHMDTTKGPSRQSDVRNSKDEHPPSSNIKNGAGGMKDSQEFAQDGLEFADAENMTPLGLNPDGNPELNLPLQASPEPDGANQVNPDEQDAVGFPEPNLPAQVPSQVDRGSVAHPQKPDAATADKFIGRFPSAEDDSHFFAYFLTAIVLCVMGYLAFHNKRKILALIVEGRHERLRRHSVYKRLDSADDDLSGRKGRGSF